MNVNNNTNIGSKNFYYIDRQGAVQVDTNRGFFAPLTRKITSLWRNYNLFNVHAALKNPNILNVTQDEQDYISSKVAKKCGVTESQYRTLVSMSNKERGDYSQFLSEIEKNKTFNKNVTALIKNTKGLLTVSSETLGEVSAYSHKTTMKKELKRVAQKAQTVFTEYQANQAISDTDKLSLKEVRTLESAAKMQPIFDKWEQYHTHTTSFAKFHTASKTSSAFIETMLTQAETESPSEPGTFIMYDMETDYALRGQKVSKVQQFIFNRLMKTNISHIALGYRSVDNKDMEAHMWGSPVSKYMLSRRSLGNRCFQTFRMDPKQMLDDEAKSKLHTLYGDTWEQTVLNQYQQTTQKYFTENPRLLELRNPSFRRFMAAIGFRFSLFNKTWEERSQFPANNEVICSEFSVLASLQCVMALNNGTQKDWKDKELEGEAPKLQPPIRENRRLNRVVPHEIVSHLSGQRFGSVSQQAPCIRSVINCNEAGLMF